MADQHIELLKQFVSLCKANPAILHDNRYAFYKEYLESLGAKIPPHSSTGSEEQHTDEAHTAPEPEQSPQAEPEEEEIPPPELDESGVIPPEKDDPLPMGDMDKEVTDEDLEKANEYRDQANMAFSEGNYEESVKQYTAAIECNPKSAILHAKRANVLLKLSKPIAAIRDCDKAIQLNPDSAQGYKFRGRAYRLLGKWLEAKSDLALACKLDFDDTANEWLKEVEPNAKKLHDHNRAKERQKEERELRARRERVRKAQEANKRAAEEGANQEASYGDDKTGEQFGLFNELFKELADDPELLRMLKEDPSLIGTLTEIMNNPSSMMKHMGNPAVQKLLSKLGSKFAPGGMPDFGDAKEEFNPSFDSADATTASQPPKKAPEPDLD